MFSAEARCRDEDCGTDGAKGSSSARGFVFRGSEMLLERFRYQIDHAAGAHSRRFHMMCAPRGGPRFSETLERSRGGAVAQQREGIAPRSQAAGTRRRIEPEVIVRCSTGRGTGSTRLLPVANPNFESTAAHSRRRHRESHLRRKTLENFAANSAGVLDRVSLSTNAGRAAARARRPTVDLPEPTGGPGHWAIETWANSCTTWAYSGGKARQSPTEPPGTEDRCLESCCIIFLALVSAHCLS